MRAPGSLGGAHRFAVRQAAREHEGVAVTSEAARSIAGPRVVQAERWGDLVVGLACGIVEVAPSRFYRR